MNIVKKIIRIAALLVASLVVFFAVVTGIPYLLLNEGSLPDEQYAIEIRSQVLAAKNNLDQLCEQVNCLSARKNDEVIFVVFRTFFTDDWGYAYAIDSAFENLNSKHFLGKEISPGVFHFYNPG